MSNNYAMIPWNFNVSLPHKGKWSVEESHRFCFRYAASHYENFPVVFGIFNLEAVRALASIYCFARFADDFADEPQFEGIRLQLLDLWSRELEMCTELNGKRPNHPVFISLQDTIEKNRLPVEPFFHLLSAFKQDCLKNRYETMNDVFDYCKRSANPVGRLVLMVMGKATEKAVELSDKTCTSLQLINFWQDLSVDIKRNRLYVPLEVCWKYGVDPESIIRGNPSNGFSNVLRELISTARKLMKEAYMLPSIVGFPSGFYLSAVQAGGLRILDLVEKMGGNIIQRRPALKLIDMISIFWSAAKFATKSNLLIRKEAI